MKEHGTVTCGIILLSKLAELMLPNRMALATTHHHLQPPRTATTHHHHRHHPPSPPATTHHHHRHHPPSPPTITTATHRHHPTTTSSHHAPSLTTITATTPPRTTTTTHHLQPPRTTTTHHLQPPRTTTTHHHRHHPPPPASRRHTSSRLIIIESIPNEFPKLIAPLKSSSFSSSRPDSPLTTHRKLVGVSDCYDMKARYDCSCRLDDSIIPDHLREGYGGFVIDMKLRHILERANGDDPVVLGSFEELLQYPTFEFLNAIVIGCLTLCTRLTIPPGFKIKVADQVLSLAKSMWNDAENEGVEKVMPIAVEVVVRNVQEPNESEQEAIVRAFSDCADDIMEVFYQRASANDNISPTYKEHVAARKSSLKALKYSRLEDLSLDKSCEICGGKFSLGMAVGRMPCSHVFHANCIINNLATSNDCVNCPVPRILLAESKSSFP
ncbi:hypothetical protein Vadar_018284 [Vaccinium darrowii]|uniref:Uncharacterized protein n=1 Tax=Vaccinium darrowii TaxID=229202 RepID=A0ACB7XRH6_9ERIC|nr:hypothetical protein Vadar_018284 [Vaccinium darrowii]